MNSISSIVSLILLMSHFVFITAQISTPEEAINLLEQSWQPTSITDICGSTHDNLMLSGFAFFQNEQDNIDEISLSYDIQLYGTLTVDTLLFSVSYYEPGDLFELDMLEADINAEPMFYSVKFPLPNVFTFSAAESCEACNCGFNVNAVLPPTAIESIDLKNNVSLQIQDGNLLCSNKQASDLLTVEVYSISGKLVRVEQWRESSIAIPLFSINDATLLLVVVRDEKSQIVTSETLALH